MSGLVAAVMNPVRRRARRPVAGAGGLDGQPAQHGHGEQRVDPAGSRSNSPPSPP